MGLSRGTSTSMCSDKGMPLASGHSVGRQQAQDCSWLLCSDSPAPSGPWGVCSRGSRVQCTPRPGGGRPRGLRQEQVEVSWANTPLTPPGKCWACWELCSGTIPCMPRAAGRLCGPRVPAGSLCSSSSDPTLQTLSKAARPAASWSPTLACTLWQLGAPTFPIPRVGSCPGGGGWSVETESIPHSPHRGSCPTGLAQLPAPAHWPSPQGVGRALPLRPPPPSWLEGV